MTTIDDLIKLDVARDNDGTEQDAFEEWAKSERYDMAQHPLHYIFLDERTSAARNAWRAGIRHAQKRLVASVPTAPASVDPWFPIDTAPKDGTAILLGGCTWGPNVRVGSWEKARFNRSTRDYDSDWCSGSDQGGINPTHWIPLPQEPRT